MDFALWELAEAGDPQDEIAALIRLNPSIPLAPEVRVVSTFGDIVTCRVKRELIPEIWLDESVVSFKAGRGLLPEDDVDPVLLPTLDLPESEQDVVILPTDHRRPPDLNETGKGVVMGFIDWGLDFAHPDFLNPDGSSRLLAIWDQKAAAPTSPEPYGYGIVHTRQDINRALKTDNPYKTLNYFPAASDPANDGSHATHVAGIAAGNGQAGGPVGVAPNADIVFVNMTSLNSLGQDKLGDSVSLAEAVHFIFETAGDAPCVINLSMGRHGEPHDGTTLIEQAFDNLLKEKTNRSIIQSCGNYYSRAIHTSGRIRPGETLTFDWQIHDGDKTPNQLEVWYSGRDVLDVEITSPDKSVVVREALGKRGEIVIDGTIIGHLYHRKREPNNLDNHIAVYLYPQAPTGTWKISLIAKDVLDGRFDAWIERDWGTSKNQSTFREHDAVADCTTGTICNGCRTIAVGAYNPHSHQLEMGKFSSAGPTRDGRLKPDIAAPGVHILAARSAPQNSLDPERPLLTRKSGTSMAAPHVAGTVALMYEATQQPLTVEDVHRLLLGSTQWDPRMDMESNRYGSGYLDIENAVDATRNFKKHPARSLPEMKETSMERMKEFAYAASGYGEQESISEAEYAVSEERKKRKKKQDADMPGFDDKEVITLEAGQEKRFLLKPEANTNSAWEFTLEGDTDSLLVSLDALPLPPDSSSFSDDASFQLLTISALTPGKARVILTPQGSEKSSDTEKIYSIHVTSSEERASKSSKREKKTEDYNEESPKWEAWVSENHAQSGESELLESLMRRIEVLEASHVETEDVDTEIYEAQDEWYQQEASSGLLTEYSVSELSDCSGCSGTPIELSPSINNIADELIESGIDIPVSSEAFIQKTFEQANLQHWLPSSLELFEALASGGINHLKSVLEDYYDVIGTPGVPLYQAVESGDILIRRMVGEGALTHAALVDSSSLLAREQLIDEGLSSESNAPGWYAQVIEGGFLPHSSSHGYARRILDWNGRVMENQMILRPLTEAVQTGKPYIQWIQSSLNQLLGLALAVDGIAGPKTRQAVMSFQKQKGLVADGVVGPKTEQALVNAGASPPPGASSSGGNIIPADWINRCQGKSTVLDQFDYDRSELKPQHQTILDSLARQIVQSQKTSSPVEAACLLGHTDNTGTDIYNAQLGQNRADNALKALIASVDALQPGLSSKVAMRSFTLGERQPVGDEKTDHGRALNRRVAIILNSKSAPKPKPPTPKLGVCFKPSVSKDDPTTLSIASVGFQDFDAGSATILGKSFKVFGRAFYPAEGNGKDKPFNKKIADAGTAPIVFIVHGNHATFRDPKNKFAEDCEDTGGLVPIPNHLGYVYFQEMLAKMGVISVSVNCNETNCDGNSATNIRQRAGLILEAMRHYIGKHKGSDPIFGGRIDFAKTGLMGHSRGAEAVLVAPELLGARPAGLDDIVIRSVISIAPTDDEASTGIPNGYALLVLLPAGDGDVVTNDGAKYYDQGVPSPFKCQLYIHKTNHNFFNREWPKDESKGPPVLSRTQHERILSVYGGAFFRDTLLNQPFRRFLRVDELPPATPVDEVHISYEEKGPITVDDYQNRNIALNALSQPTAQSNGLTAAEFDFSQTGSATFNGSFYGNTVGMVAQTSAVTGDFASQLGSPTDLTGKEVWIRAAEVYNGSSVPAGATGFLLGLEDSKGQVALVDSKNVLNGLPRPYDRRADDLKARYRTDITKTMLKTFRFPVNCFAKTSGFDITQVTAIHVQLNRNDKRAIAFDQFQIV